MIIILSMKRIAIIDSGIGGLSYLMPIKQLLKDDYSYIYLADLLNFPYGTKTENELKQIFTDLAYKLKKFQIDVLLIACNTASLYGIDIFKDILAIPVVPTYPAINLATTSPLAILATKASTESAYLQRLIKDSSFSSNTHLIAATKLVDLAELHFFDYSKSQKEAILEPFIKQIKQLEAKNLLLGCTHFVFLEHNIKNLLQDSKIDIINNTAFIANTVKELAEKTTDTNKDFIFPDGFYLTKLSHADLDKVDLYKKWANYANLDLKGEF